MTLLEHIKNAGFPYWQEVIHLFVGGSALHGAKVEGYDDLDIYGVFVEPPEKALGIDHYRHFVWSTSDKDKKNTKDDVDITLYSLQKWAELACKGNPSILHFLFADNTLEDKLPWDTWFNAVRKYRNVFLCSKHASAFIGFATAQLSRLAGERSMNVSRPDLVEKYGYDTKFAMHVIRLFSECEQLMRSGVITLPSPEKRLLINIRTGEYTLDWVLREAIRRTDLCREAEASSCLPKELDRNFISKVISDAYRRHWEKWKI